MHYLLDVTIFSIFALMLLLASSHWWKADDQRSSLLEYSLIHVSTLLGGAALYIWLDGWAGKGGIPIGWIPWLMIGVVSLLWQEHRQRSVAYVRMAFSRLLNLRNLSVLDLALALYLLLIFTLTFVLTLAPPSGGDYDSLVYHLAAPRQYLRANRIVELPYDHHTYFPFTMEMLYLMGLKLQGPVLAKLFHWLMLPLSCAALIAMGRRHLSLRAGLSAAALFASLPVVQAEASTAYIDLGLTAFSLLAFLCFTNWLATRKGWWLAWSGVFCGFCLGTKYLGVLTFGWLLLWAIGSMSRSKRFQAAPLTLFVLWALVLGGGWYVRNWWWTGNPVFPFAYEIFGGEGWTLAMAKAYTQDQMKFGFGRALIDWLWLPWRLSMTPLNLGVVGREVVGLPFWPFTTVPLANANNGLFEVLPMVLQSVVGPALLAFSIPLLAIRRKPPIIGLVLWSFAFFFVFWTVTGQYLRYLVPAFALLCLACGWGVEQYLKRSAILKWTTAAALLAWLAITPALTLRHARGSLPVIAGQETPEAYLVRTFPAYEAMRWASTQTPANARFAVYGEPRCFYLERDYFWADDMHNNLIDYNAIATGEDFAHALTRLGATHALWNTVPGRNGGVGGPPSQIEEAVAGGQLRLLFEARGYRIYEIAPGSKAAP